MFNTETIVSLLAAAVLGGGLVYYLTGRKPAQPAATPSPLPGSTIAGTVSSNASLALQAYERLILLCSRIALPQLLQSISNQGLTVSEMQFALSRQIREEFDYNVTQQLYVSAESWNALKNFKEKNLLIIHQCAQQLPSEAPALELQKAILGFLMQEPKADLHGLVSEALSYEAKKLI